MACNELLAVRIGGLAFMVKDKMCCGVVKDDLMVRVADDRYEMALSKPGAREMDFTGRPMRGFVFVSGEGISSEKSLREWLKMGIEFAATAKSKPRKKSKRTRKG